MTVQETERPHRFKAVVIGLGNIGLEFDYDCTDHSRILTHAAGFATHPGFELIGGVDPNPEARKRFTARYGRPAFSSFADLAQRHQPEVISIGVPTPLHVQTFHEAMSVSPRAILAEKPLAEEFEDAYQMVKRAAESNCLLLVNYIRRFLPASHQLRQLITSGQAGDIFKGVLWYSKGLLNNGSHFIDLLRFLLGEVTDIAVLQPGRLWQDRDPEPDLRLRFGKTDIFFLAGREENISVKHFELLATAGKICYLGGGERIRFFPTRPHPVFAGYTTLAGESRDFDGDLYRYQSHVTEALYRGLTRGTPIASDGESALETLRVVSEILRLRKEVTHE